MKNKKSLEWQEGYEQGRKDMEQEIFTSVEKAIERKNVIINYMREDMNLKRNKFLKRLTNCLLIFLVFLSGFVSSIFYIYSIQSSQAFVTPILNNQIIISMPSPINSTEVLLEKISDIAFANTLNKTFKLNYYDCTQYSQDLVIELNKSNISSYCIFGRISTGKYTYGLHSWVGVIIEGTEYYFDAVGGFRISPEIWESWDYKILTRGKCL